MSIQPESVRGGAGEQTVDQVEDEQSLSTGDIHFTLSNCRRRFLIRYLSREEWTTVKELSWAIAEWENGMSAEELSYDDRKTVYTALLQTHLPKLNDLGVVEYDASSKRVRLAERADQLRPYLELEREGTGEESAGAARYTRVVAVLLAGAASGVLLGRYAAVGLEGALVTGLSFGVAAAVAIAAVLVSTGTPGA